MERRNILRITLAMAAAAFATVRSAGKADAAEPAVPKVVYHLSDLDKAAFVLGNIQNHFSGMGGPDKVTIALVVHGPALKAFYVASAPPDVSTALSGLSKAGVSLNACANTMRAQQVALADLLPGFVTAEKGGVVRLTELQMQGYAYLRP